MEGFKGYAANQYSKLEHMLNVAKSMADSDADSVTGLTLLYSVADAHIVSALHSFSGFQDMQERIKQQSEKRVIQAIKNATERFVTIGGCAEHPMVIIDMLTKEYNVMYGFGEEHRGYSFALEKQGFKANPNLYLHQKQDSGAVMGYNPKFDASILFGIM